MCLCLLLPGLDEGPGSINRPGGSPRSRQAAFHQRDIRVWSGPPSSKAKGAPVDQWPPLLTEKPPICCTDRAYEVLSRHRSASVHCAGVPVCQQSAGSGSAHSCHGAIHGGVQDRQAGKHSLPMQIITTHVQSLLQDSWTCMHLNLPSICKASVFDI